VLQWRELLLQQQTSSENALMPFLPLYKEESDQDLLAQLDSAQIDPTFECRNTLDGLANTTINCLSINQLLKIYMPVLLSHSKSLIKTHRT
jgi:hypothetical protein